jgi:hypothetical protein
MGAALSVLKRIPASSGSTEEQRCLYLEETYSKAIPDWVGEAATALAAETGASNKAAKVGEIYDALTALHDFKGEPLSIIQLSPAWQSHVKQYQLTLDGTYSTDDPAVVDVTRRIAARRDTVRIVSDGRQYYIYKRAADLPQQQAQKSGGCFVATAACGDRLAHEVVVLSAFRDDVLSCSGIGRGFIAAYYAISPPIAGVIAQSSFLRRMTMSTVVKPLASAISKRGGR